MLDQTQKTDKHQQLMDQAYDRWQKNQHWSQEEFFDELTPAEKFAVAFGNLNYQVENGGFGQWWGNDYGTAETVSYLKRQSRKLGESGRLLADMLDEYTHETKGLTQQEFSREHCSNRWGDFDEEGFEETERALDELTDQFYAMNADLMAAVEAHLQTM